VVGVTSCLVGSYRGNVSVVGDLTSSAAFLFGVLLAFSIQRTRERLSTVQNLVSNGNSHLLAMYHLMVAFDVETRQKIRDLIDFHLTDQINYRLVDHYLADDSFFQLANEISLLECRTKEQENTYKNLLDICVKMIADRSNIESATAQPMSTTEWLGLLTLLVLLLTLLTVLPGGNVLGAVVVGVLAGAVVVLIALLRKLDRLRWHERVTIWEPTTRLFRSMGQHPYVPREVIDSGRYCPTGLVRVVDFPDPYPDRSTSIVTVEDRGIGEFETRITAGARPGRHTAEALRNNDGAPNRAFVPRPSRALQEEAPHHDPERRGSFRR
jgi:hypothetical protein